MKWSLIIAILIALFVVFYKGLCEPGVLYPDGCYVVDPDSPIERACRKMGPGYDYRLWPDGRLEVFLNGKWLKLRY